jgi:pyruvate dehydrogenase E1 component alpha subunit
MKPSNEQLIDMYQKMMLIRSFEYKTKELFGAGALPGFVHLYIGEEAIAVGVCTNLRKDDYITSTHRGHGHCIAKGAHVDRMMAELFGKKTGYCGGKGGSMHIADFSIGMLGCSGVVGGGIPLATGAGLAAKFNKSDQVAVAFFGDGATNQGSFHESLNLAAIWKLPVLYVCENNQYAESTLASEVIATKTVAERAAAYGIPGICVDGTDVLCVCEASRAAVERARKGQGPTLLECVAFRWEGHYVGDSATYRPKGTLEEYKKNDPIAKLKARLQQEGIMSESELVKIEGETASQIEEAVKFAQESAWPDPQSALMDVFVSPYY